MSMKKCRKCGWFSDKCKNRNSKNFNKWEEDIKKCKPLLIDKNKELCSK
jgi:hypothetical protein